MLYGTIWARVIDGCRRSGPQERPKVAVDVQQRIYDSLNSDVVCVLNDRLQASVAKNGLGIRGIGRLKEQFWSYYWE